MAEKVTSVFRAGLFKKKSAIITGGGGGLGIAMAHELLHLGCNVMIASRKLEHLVPAYDKLSASKPADSTVKYMQCNIRDENQVKDLIAGTLDSFGRLDYVVNNGGGQFISRAADISAKGWNAVVDTNLNGTFHMCKYAYNMYMKEHGGSIVNIIAAMYTGMPGMSPSGAARAGVENLTKSLALEWAEDGVRINCICPGTIPSETAAANYGWEMSQWDQFKPNIPAKRLGKPEEISAALCYLLSPAAAFVTGETLKVDGAQTLYTTQVPWPIPDHDKFPTYSWEEDIKQQEAELSTETPPKSKL